MPLSLRHRDKTGNGDRAQYDKRQNSDHFAQRQPELEFAVVLDAQQVTAGEGESDDPGEQPHRTPGTHECRIIAAILASSGITRPRTTSTASRWYTRPAADGFIGVGGKSRYPAWRPPFRPAYA